MIEVPDRDRGQSAVMVMFVAAALFVGISVATVSVGSVVIGRAEAQSAADAAALAAVTDGHQGAIRFAGLHGATVISFERAGDVITVTVRLGDRTATASATDGP